MHPRSRSASAAAAAPAAASAPAATTVRAVAGAATGRLPATAAILAAFLAAGAFTARPAAAVTWRVEADGSGDFTGLQAAADAAASGDTLRVGAGRFATLQSRATVDGTFETALCVPVPDLTVIGAGRDLTFIGPPTWYGPVGEYPKGVTATGAGVVRLRGLTVENLPHAVWWHGGTVDLRDCRLRAGGFGFIGLHADGAGGAAVDCAFETTEEDGFAVWLDGAPSFAVTGCRFDGPGSGVTVAGASTGVAVAGCEVAGAFGGILFDGSAGSVTDCLVTAAAVVGFAAVGGAQVSLDHLFVRGADTGLHVGSGADVTGDAVVLEQTQNTAVALDGDAVLALHGSHLLPSAGRAVSCWGYPGATVTQDLTGNWWGVTDAAAVAAMIHDLADDADVHCLVDYEPLAGAPLGAAAVSWGDLKASFR